MKKLEKTKSDTSKPPRFSDENAEATWWASTEGRAFLKQQPKAALKKQTGSPLVAQVSRASSVQIALRLPVPDLAKAREIADRKGIGYQTLLKMLVHEGLQREVRRQ